MDCRTLTLTLTLALTLTRTRTRTLTLTLTLSLTLSTMDCSVRSVRTRSRGLVPRLESHVGQTWLSRKWRMMHARQKVCRHSMMVPAMGGARG